MSTNLPPMVQTAADAGREVLQNAGVDLEQLEQRRELAAAMLPPVLAAARGVIDNLGKPGAAARFGTLADAVENLTQNDPISAVVVAAAIWADRYGSAGAPERLTDLQDAVDGLHRPELGTIIDITPEQEAYERMCIGECTCQNDAPAGSLD